jgi:ATP-binding cassette subfamily G (WHITE) protein 2 (PDR)
MEENRIDDWFQNHKDAQERLWSNQVSTRFGVSFRNLSVQGRSTEDRFFTTFLSAPITFLKTTLRSLSVKTTILYGIDGLVEQGEMLLVLGRPGSGCSTLLKTLALETQGLYLDPRSEFNYEGE